MTRWLDGAREAANHSPPQNLGADANGIYITTNEFDLFGPFFHASQIYAFSKHDLAAGSPSVTLFQYDPTDFQVVAIPPDITVPDFTVWPAQSPGANNFPTQVHGTEFFLSSRAVFTTNDNRIVLWALTNTRALNAGNAPSLSNTLVTTVAYTNPPAVEPAGFDHQRCHQEPAVGAVH